MIIATVDLAQAIEVYRDASARVLGARDADVEPHALDVAHLDGAVSALTLAGETATLKLLADEQRLFEVSATAAGLSPRQASRLANVTRDLSCIEQRLRAT